MTYLSALSELARSCLSLWALFICIAGIFSVVLSLTRKLFRFTVLSVPPFLCSFFLWQVLFDLHLFGETEPASAVSRALAGTPYLLWTAALLILSACALFILFSVIREGKRKITPSAVKHCLDRMPCGVCCWRDDGRVLFSNDCMNRLCMLLTGSPLLNGISFADAAAEGVVSLGGSQWRFSRREIGFEGELLHEMTASDVTNEYSRTRALEKDKAELSRLNRELKEYTLGIDDTVRRQEILRAKVSIHDEMNRLMLSTSAAEKDDPGRLDGILSLWEQNALLLCMEAENQSGGKDENGLDGLARALKILLVRNGEVPAALSERQRALYYVAAREALANAAKHARAQTVTVSFAETGSEISCVFENDGIPPSGEIRFSGGLSNLSRLAREQGARVSAVASDTFSLRLVFPKPDNTVEE